MFISCFIRVHGVTISLKADLVYEAVDDLLAEYNVRSPEGTLVAAREIIDIIDGYIGKAYGCTTEAELGQNDFISSSCTVLGRISHCYFIMCCTSPV